MKKWPLKIKLTFLYTVFMTLTICISLGILLSLGNQEFLSSVQEELKERVHESLDEIQIDKEGLIVDKDFYDVEDGIYLSVFNQQGDFLYGRIPYGFNSQVQPKDGHIQAESKKGSFSRCRYSRNRCFQSSGFQGTG